jgi:hypothetical protein
MTAILNLIYCFLTDMIARFVDVWVGMWDSLLSVVDTVLLSVGAGSLSIVPIPDEYAWVLGATGMSQAVAILAGAMATRFILQAVPFVRWGS